MEWNCEEIPQQMSASRRFHKENPFCEKICRGNTCVYHMGNMFYFRFTEEYYTRPCEPQLKKRTSIGRRPIT